MGGDIFPYFPKAAALSRWIFRRVNGSSLEILMLLILSPIKTNINFVVYIFNEKETNKELFNEYVERSDCLVSVGSERFVV